MNRSLKGPLLDPSRTQFRCDETDVQSPTASMVVHSVLAHHADSINVINLRVKNSRIRNAISAQLVSSAK
jgi:hypothetical protein